ncbi:MAG: hypothetical protein J6568_08030 [Snodgrassella sp.]|nr:hypothetical protein [Snodgrassella sp.]
MASNSAVTANLLQRQLDVDSKQQLIVAGLSYIRANHYCNYLCVLLHLSQRQIAPAMVLGNINSRLSDLCIKSFKPL